MKIKLNDRYVVIKIFNNKKAGQALCGLMCTEFVDLSHEHKWSRGEILTPVFQRWGIPDMRGQVVIDVIINELARPELYSICLISLVAPNWETYFSISSYTYKSIYTYTDIYRAKTFHFVKITFWLENA